MTHDAISLMLEVEPSSFDLEIEFTKAERNEIARVYSQLGALLMHFAQRSVCR
ncbi:MAG: hypothetical protein Q8L08_04430 [Candidatus Nanopelagicaceae bacterium]|nr:hypothetical protein [Candidatus Nanopelagicaceae bacterium]